MSENTIPSLIRKSRVFLALALNPLILPCLTSGTVIRAGTAPVICTINAGDDAASTIQECINTTPSGGTVLIPPGTYVINNQIAITKSITLGTAGRTESDPRCGDGITQYSAPAAVRDSRCATFVASNQFNKNLATPGAIIYVEAGNVTLDHVIVDGNHDGRWGQVGAHCTEAGFSPEQFYTIQVGGKETQGVDNFAMKNSAVTEAVCWSGLHIAFSFYVTLANNLIAYNGRHDHNLGWSDGVTLEGTPGGTAPSQYTIAYNRFLGNADSQIFIQQCRNCSIHDNFFWNPRNNPDDNYNYASHSALTFGPFRDGEPDLDFTGSEVRGNLIDCGPLVGRSPDGTANYRWGCGVGIAVGQGAWGHLAAVTNLSVHDNTVFQGAQIGLLVEYGKGVYLSNNQVGTGNGAGGNNGPGCLGGLFFPAAVDNSHLTYDIASTVPASSVIRYGNTPPFDQWSSYQFRTVPSVPNLIDQCQ